jgi:hypothetical protein
VHLYYPVGLIIQPVSDASVSSRLREDRASQTEVLSAVEQRTELDQLHINLDRASAVVDRRNFEAFGRSTTAGQSVEFDNVMEDRSQHCTVVEESFGK